MEGESGRAKLRSEPETVQHSRIGFGVNIDRHETRIEERV